MKLATVYGIDSLDDIRPEQIGENTYFVTNDGVLYQAKFDPQLGGWLTSVIQGGFSLVGGLFGGGGGNSGIARGLAAINQFGGELIGALQQLIQQAAAGMPQQEVYQKADQLVALLSDPTAVYQAQRGKDADALKNFKTQAAQLAQQAKATADNFAARNTGGGNAAANGGNAVNSNMMPFLLIGGGAVMLLLLIR